jgi:hypothetical protein
MILQGLAYCPLICEVCEKTYNLYTPHLHKCDVSKLHKKIEYFVFQLNAEKVLNEQNQACQTGRTKSGHNQSTKKANKKTAIRSKATRKASRVSSK